MLHLYPLKQQTFFIEHQNKLWTKTSPGINFIETFQSGKGNLFEKKHIIFLTSLIRTDCEL